MGSNGSDALINKEGKGACHNHTKGSGGVCVGGGFLCFVATEYLLGAVPSPGTECVLSLSFLPGHGVRFSPHCAAEERQALGY